MRPTGRYGLPAQAVYSIQLIPMYHAESDAAAIVRRIGPSRTRALCGCTLVEVQDEPYADRELCRKCAKSRGRSST